MDKPGKTEKNKDRGVGDRGSRGVGDRGSRGVGDRGSPAGGSAGSDENDGGRGVGARG